MRDLLGQLLAFSMKEALEVIRQPRLVFSLLLGPVLILLLFGIGYTTDRPNLRAVLVVPPDPPVGYPVEDIKKAVAMSFNLVGVVHDRETATVSLRSGSVDVVEVWPNALDQLVVGRQKIGIEFYSNDTNPIKVSWIQYLAATQISELNKAWLTSQLTQGQRQIDDFQGLIENARALTQRLRASVTILHAEEDITRLEQETSVLIRQSEAAPPEVRQTLVQFQHDLEGLHVTIQRGQLAGQRQYLEQIVERIDRLVLVVSQLHTIPPEVVVSPLDSQYHNLARVKLDMVIFYAPAVLALLIQHIAITLGALALVRERASIEFFRIAPVTPLRLLLGKYLGYIITIAIMITILTLVIVYALGVPFLGNVWWFTLEALLLLLASLGIGFTISALSATDNQAVQLSMLVLVLSIFFSGFFLSLDSFSPAIRSLSYAIPLTHGMIAFQNELLSDRVRDITPLLWMSVIGCLSFATGLFFTARQFHQVSRSG
jgi:ABC-2 type transport system permease protein